MVKEAAETRRKTINSFIFCCVNFALENDTTRGMVLEYNAATFNMKIERIQNKDCLVQMMPNRPSDVVQEGFDIYLGAICQVAEFVCC